MAFWLTDIQLELMSGIDMFQFTEKDMGGGMHTSLIDMEKPVTSI